MRVLFADKFESSDPRLRKFEFKLKAALIGAKRHEIHCEKLKRAENASLGRNLIFTKGETSRGKEALSFNSAYFDRGLDTDTFERATFSSLSRFKLPLL